MSAAAKIEAAPMGAPRERTARPLGSRGAGALGVVFGDIGTSPLYALNAR